MTSRSIQQLRDSWKFTRSPHADAVEFSFDDADWDTVEVPHDWAIAGPFDREHDIDRKVVKGQADLEKGVQEITGRTGGLPHTGEGWYRRWIDVPATDQTLCYLLPLPGSATAMPHPSNPSRGLASRRLTGCVCCTFSPGTEKLVI